MRNWPWLTLQIIAANVAIIAALAAFWYLAFLHQSSVYSDRLMATFNIEPGSFHAMYVDDVEQQLWFSVLAGLLIAILASVGLALLIGRPLRALALATERLRHGDYRVRSDVGSGEVGQLARNFNALAEDLQQEERRRSQFMADLGHELRTPIMSLRGYSEGLEDGIFIADDAYFQLISGELSHLTALTRTIETMHLAEDSTRRTAESYRYTIAALLSDSKQRWDRRLRQRGLELELHLPENAGKYQLLASDRTLKQIVDNLLSNMCRYAGTGGPCIVRVSLNPRQGEAALLFSNEAPDIDGAALPYLFDRFYRGSASRTRQHHEHASGLGLAVVRQLCITNQGNVTAQLEDTRLVISVTLPIRAPV